MSGPLVTTFHIIVAVHYISSLYYLCTTFELPQKKEFRMFHDYGGNLRFITNWDLIIQSIFFTICVFNDFFGSNEVTPKKPSAIRKFKDFLHASIGFPLGAFVAITFWGLYAVDRELVFPKVLDEHFPVWLNHVMHTNVLVFTVIELVSSYRVYPSRKNGLLALTTLMLIYLVWTFVIFFKTDRWVYPVMQVLNWPQRILFMLVLLAFTEALYFVGEILNNTVWNAVMNRKAGETSNVATGSAEVVALCNIPETDHQAKSRN